MAKFAKCGYGSDGRGLGRTTDGYTYVVNDNVRKNDVLQVIATSSRGRKFATTAKTRNVYSENSKKGQEAKQQAQQNTEGNDPTRAYTGKELGVKAFRGGAKSQVIEGLKPQTEYTMQTRAANLGEYVQTHPNATLTKHAQETFDSYSKPFMNKGDE